MNARVTKPFLLGAAVIVALLVVPVLALINASTRTAGGDGLQGFGALVLGYGALGLVTLGFAVAGWIRGERPRWLAAVAAVLLVLPVFALAM